MLNKEADFEKKEKGIEREREKRRRW